MVRKKHSVIMMVMISLFLGQVGYAQKAKKVKKTAKVESATVVEPAPVAQEVVAPVAPPVPQDRLDTIYYNKNWKVTSNKAFANYYRLALYPADSSAVKEFRTYYMSGELQGRGALSCSTKWMMQRASSSVR